MPTTSSWATGVRSPSIRRCRRPSNKAQAKATELGKTAAAKAPDYAKSAAASATSAAKAASAQVPSVVHAAADKLPRQFGGGNGKDDSADDVAADGNLVYPAEGDASTANGIRYTPDTPAT